MDTPDDSMAFTERMFEAIKHDLYRLVLAVEARAAELDIPIHQPHDPAAEPQDGRIDDNGYGFWVTLGDLERWKLDPAAYNDEPVDVTIMLIDAEAASDEGPGCNVNVDIVALEGECIGGCTPYNFTDQVWVRPDHLDPAGELHRRIPGPAEDQAAAIVRLIFGFWRQQGAKRKGG